jgi:hypothetical protein
MKTKTLGDQCVLTSCTASTCYLDRVCVLCLQVVVVPSSIFFSLLIWITGNVRILRSHDLLVHLGCRDSLCHDLSCYNVVAACHVVL